MQKSNIATIEPVEIGKNSKETEDFSDVKRFVSENYGITEDKVFIN